MKKVLLFVMSLALVVVLNSCGGGKSATPSDAAKECVELMKSGDFETLVDNCYFGEDVSAEKVEQTKAMIVAMGNEKITKKIEKKEGIASYEVIEETIAEDGQTAKVKVKINYGNGSDEVEKYDLQLIDGEWKPVIKK